MDTVFEFNSSCRLKLLLCIQIWTELHIWWDIYYVHIWTSLLARLHIELNIQLFLGINALALLWFTRACNIRIGLIIYLSTHLISSFYFLTLGLRHFYVKMDFVITIRFVKRKLEMLYLRRFQLDKVQKG